MNERIKELLSQAGFDPAPHADIDPSLISTHFQTHIDTYADKHPSLLVRQLASALRTALVLQQCCPAPKAYLFTNVINCDVTCSTDPSYKAGASWKINPLYTHTCCQPVISNTEKKGNRDD